MERVVVEYLHDDQWFWSRDYPALRLEDAKEYGRQLWKRGAAGVRITHYKPIVLVEEIRSHRAASARSTTGPSPTQE
jgi:hypothetical protein